MHSMKSVIEAIRSEIALFWEKCFYSQEQQQAFVPYHAGESYDELHSLNMGSCC